MQATTDTLSPEKSQLQSAGRSFWPILCWCLVACSVLFFVEGAKGFNIADEGFLWYGCQRVVWGELPIRDFSAYDIGRYYWVAAFMLLAGNTGILALRAAVMVFAAAGLATAGWLVNTAGIRRRSFVAAATVPICLLWMLPRHKLFDIAVSIFIVAALANVLRKRNARSFFTCGLTLGLAALVGRNHGFYGIMGCLLAAPLLLALHQPIPWRRCIAAWLGGIALGYLPAILMVCAVPGFGASFWQSLSFSAHVDTKPLPVPWPWLYFDARHLDVVQLSVGFGYVALVCFDVIGTIAVIWQARRGRLWMSSPVVVAAVLMSLPYSNHAFSRAGVEHLAQGIFPCLVGVLSLINVCDINKYLKSAEIACVTLLSLGATLPSHPAYAACGHHWSKFWVGSDRLVLDPAMAAELNGVLDLVHRYSPSNRVVATPYWPGLYAMLNTKSPVFDTYALFKRSESFQYAEIARIEKYRPDVVFILDAPLDGRDAECFSQNNPVMDGYIRSHFVRVPCGLHQPYLMVYAKRGTTASANSAGQELLQGNTLVRSR